MKHRSNFNDLTGRRFGRVTALEYLGRDDYRNSLWKCRCDCGTEFVTRRNNLVCGKTRSCGCYRTEVSRANIERAHRAWRLPVVVTSPDGIRHFFASVIEAAAWLRCSQSTVSQKLASGKAFRGHLMEKMNPQTSSK
ncbi:MAG: hypothetical protein IJ713_07425 [Oscillibacter sp.]|nr:hypothetical protein [Oscillibacter sp.]